ncbi:MAG TPA: STAS/SEC14 domain-containing protein [Flavisolibacter sp.]|nr:STAS/SEC14 domain-containing protein [Flavisolibacter sp.]
MVELLADFPQHVAAYEARGKVNKEEYEKVVMRRVDEVAAQYGKINFLVRLETGMEEYSLAALLNYLKVSFEHFTQWNRMAIVSDQKWVRKIYDALSPLVPGKIKSYELKEYEAAKQWVSAPLSEGKK